MDTTERVLAWRSGPDCNGVVALTPGSFVIGRAAQAEVRCDDPELALHHAVLEVDAGGRTTLVQLGGRRPLRLTGETIEVGGSVLAPTEPMAPTARAHVRDGALLREPRVLPAHTEPAFAEPDQPSPPPPRQGNVLPALLALAGAGAVALALRQPMFLLFGALGAVVAIGTWAAQHVGGRRERVRRRQRFGAESAALAAALDEACADFLIRHRATTPTVAGAVATIDQLGAALWTRRSHHGDAYTVAIGIGDVMWQPAGLGPTRARVLADEAVAATLGPGIRLAVRGERCAADAVLRGLIVQLAASCGPADLHLLVVSTDPARWTWIAALPHARGASGHALVGGGDEVQAMIDELPADGCVHVLVLTDAVDLLTTRTHPLRRFVAGERRPALLAVVPPGGAVPHLCTSELQVGESGGPAGARWIASTSEGLPVRLRTAGLGERTTARLVARLAPLRDPEDAIATARAIPADVDLGALLRRDDDGALTPAAIAASWLAGGNDPAPRTVLGQAADGIVDVDLLRDGPHALLAGTTGAGKSELLRSLVLGMACGSSPDHLTFVLVDYKGGSTFDGCAVLPHVVGMVTDLDERLADRALRSLRAELRHREERLRAYGVADLSGLRQTAPNEVLPRLVVIIDEFAALVAEQPGFLEALVGVAQRGRSLGMHLILATQRPQGVITEAIRANTNLRVALRLQDAGDAVDVIGDAAPAAIPRQRPGRAVMRLGAGEFLEFQTARLAAADDLVEAITQAWLMAGGALPRCPWQPPLPPLVPAERGRLGLVDDPDRQAIDELRWRPVGGNVLLVGAGGSGLTTALTAAGVAALDDPATHLYVIDATGGDDLRALGRAPRCAAIVTIGEHERLARLLARLSAWCVDFPPKIGGKSTHPVLLIDGYPRLRQQLDELDTAAQYDALETIISGASGVTVVLTADRPGAVPAGVLARCAQRWVFHLREPHDAVLLGLSPADVPAPGRPGRVILAPSRLEAQLALPGALPLDGTAAPAIEVLPSVVNAAGLPPSTAAGGTSHLICGSRFADGEPAVIAVHDGEHVLVIGPARSGRSTALARLAGGWRQGHPDGTVIALRSHRSPFADADADVDTAAELVTVIERTAGDVLAVVDDAELVDDHGGRLAALAAGRRPGLLVLASGRPDALRQSYGHWTTVVRRSRLGLAMAACGELDGDLLAAPLPRRLPVAARPGLAWIIGDGPPLLAQLAY